MKRTAKSVFSRCFGAWLLVFALLLSGCTSGQDSSGGEGGATGSPAPSASEQPTASDQPLDYSKYNAYLDVLNSVYEMDGLLTAYFTVVQNQPEFTLVDGMDYSMLDDSFSFYTFNSYTMEKAMGYCDEEPDYPEQDALLETLNEPFQAMGEVLSDLGMYISYKDYEDDGLAKAAQLHTLLYEAVAAFDEAALPFAQSMDVLDDATEQAELDRLKEEGLNIAYYSRVMLNLSNDIDAEVWAQLSQSETEGLPPLDMTNLEPLYTQHQEAYAGLAEALADSEQMKAMWPDETSAETQADVYASAASNVSIALDNFITAARNQEDYSQYYDSYSLAVSHLIDLYNAVISG